MIKRFLYRIQDWAWVKWHLRVPVFIIGLCAGLAFGVLLCAV